MKSQPGKQTNTVHILPIISRSKGNEAIKFRLLIKYNMKNIFKAIRKIWRINYSQPFSKKSKLSISLDQ